MLSSSLTRKHVGPLSLIPGEPSFGSVGLAAHAPFFSSQVLKAVSTAQLRYVTSTTEDVGRCVSLKQKSVDKASKTVVFDAKKLESGQTE